MNKLNQGDGRRLFHEFGKLLENREFEKIKSKRGELKKWALDRGVVLQGKETISRPTDYKQETIKYQQHKSEVDKIFEGV